MAQTRYEDLAIAAAVLNTDTLLVGRLDTAVLGVTSTEAAKKRVTGIMARDADAGYLVGRLAGNVVFTADLPILNALTEFADLAIDVPAGQTFSLYVHDTAGTVACACTVRYEVP